MKDYFSSNLKSLLEGLLEMNTKKRLDIAKVMKHPFFKKINWEAAIDKKLKPPFKPKIKKQINFVIQKHEKMELKDELNPNKLEKGLTNDIVNFLDEGVGRTTTQDGERFENFSYYKKNGSISYK